MASDINTAQAVEIVGIGAVTGFGWGVQSLWDGLIAGKSAAEPVEFDDCASLAVLVPEGGDENDSITLFGRALYGSGREAIADAKSRGWQPGERVGFILCSSLGEIQGWRDLYFTEGRHLRRRHFLQLLPSTAPSMFMAEYGFKGPSLNAGQPAPREHLASSWPVNGSAPASPPMSSSAAPISRSLPRPPSTSPTSG